VTPIRTYLEALVSQALPEGGWSYAPGQSAHLEPTCLALLALAKEPGAFRDEVEQGFAAVRRCAGPDGAFRLIDGRDEAIWPTSLVLFLQAVSSFPKAEIQGTAARLLSLQGRQADEHQAEDVHDIDLKLIGWPWAEGNFSWAEPTAWACLALRHAGFGNHERVVEGIRLLLDRTFDEGGINYGNRTILGRATEPIPGPTAIMMLALQGHGHEPRVAASAKYLLGEALASDDLEHLCWAKIALDCHPDLPGTTQALALLDERIVAAYPARAERFWLSPAPLRVALTALALGTPLGNPFRLPAAQEQGLRTGNGHVKVTPAKYTPPRKPWAYRLKAAFRGLAVEAIGRLRQLPPQSSVHIAPANDYNGDLAGTLLRQFEAFRARVPLAGKRVLLKPNMVEYHRDKVINTHPSVVAAVIELCKKEGAAEIIVAEGPGHCRNVEFLVKESGLGEVLRHYKIPFKDLNHDEPVKSPNLGRLTGLEYLYMSRTVATAEVLISLPKLKTHHWAGATLSLKNLFGTLPGICYGWPKNELHWRGIDNSIVDIALTRTPDLAIVDGIIGMDGDGPLNGNAKPLGALIMGCDLLAVDATCCRLMELDPQRIAYLVLGYQKKLGLMRPHEIAQLGERIETLAKPFETVPHFNGLRLARSA
jgi:uncharacterized protein (DUF362 family)